MTALRTTCAQSPAAGYEVPPVFRASSFLTPDELAGPMHRVRDEVFTDGVTNTYTIDSDFGAFVAHGNDMVLERIYEVYAIAAIRRTKQSDAYTNALADATKGTVQGAKNLVNDPKKAVTGMGKGAIRFIKGAGERVRTMSDATATADSMSQYSDAKRKIAAFYKVDPYTSNPILRKEIEDLAAAAKLGNLTFSLATMALPGGGLGGLTKGVSASAQLNQMLVDQGPYTLRTENRKRLAAMALDADLIESFLNHPVLTPKHQTVISIALEKLDRTRARGTVLRLAMDSQSEEDARFFAHVAGLIAHYHKTRSPVLEIFDFYGMPACYTAEQKLVFPMFLDYGSWSETGAQFARLSQEFNRPGLPIVGREWFITGTLSPRARKELAALGLSLTENAMAGASF